MCIGPGDRDLIGACALQATHHCSVQPPGPVRAIHSSSCEENGCYQAWQSLGQSPAHGPLVTPVGEITGGVDTHLDFHVAAAREGLGRVLGTQKFPATMAGFTTLLAWLRSFGPLAVVGVEGTGSYGAGLTGYLNAHGVRVVEVNRPNRQKRRLNGKSDPADAINAAAATQTGDAITSPKPRHGPIESVHVLRTTRDHWIKSRTAAIKIAAAFTFTQ